MIGSGHIDHFFLFVDLVKEPPVPDAASPGRMIPILEPLDIGTEVRFIS